VTNNTKTQKSLKNASVIIKCRAQTQSLLMRQKQTANQSEAMTSWDVRTDNNRFTKEYKWPRSGQERRLSM